MMVLRIEQTHPGHPRDLVMRRPVPLADDLAFVDMEGSFQAPKVAVFEYVGYGNLFWYYQFKRFEGG